MENKHFSLKATFGLTDVDAQQTVNDFTIALGRGLRADIRDPGKSIEVEFRSLETISVTYYRSRPLHSSLRKEKNSGEN